MQPTATGLIVVALGIWCQFGGYKRIFLSMVIFTLFEAADAADLTALGGASVTPAKLFLAFFVLRIMSMKNGLGAMLDEISPRRVLFIYLLLTLWVVTSAIFLPQLFAYTTDVYSLDRATVDVGAIPLKPSSGNITQSVYAIGSFVIAIGFSVLGRKPGAFETMLRGILIVTGVNIFFAFADLVTSATNTAFLLDFLHTGNYALLTDNDLGGVKRISGSFTEASSFATFSLDLLAINFTLCLQRIRPRLTGTFSVVLAALLFASTSSTAYGGLAVFSAVFVAIAIYTAVRHGNMRYVKILGVWAAAGIFLFCMILLFVPSFLTAVWTMLDVSLFQKSTSESAIERGELNTQAIKVFFDTYGIGAGVGSTRTSNYILVLASNLGVAGLVLFALLILALAFLRPRDTLGPRERSILIALRVGLLASLVPATLIGTIFDLGPLFYILLGLVASSSENREVTEGERERRGAPMLTRQNVTRKGVRILEDRPLA